MENYIGKICPFCKTEIKEGDTVKVCPACNIPHHESCWEENKGLSLIHIYLLRLYSNFHIQRHIRLLCLCKQL